MFGSVGAQPPPAMPISSDRIALPPVRREFTSPERSYLLVVENADQWKTSYPTARLYRTGQGQSVLCWTRVLTQQYGPRGAVVAGDGHVLFVDEWINVTSRWALVLVDVENRVIATHDYKTAVGALAVSPAEIAAHARSGPWISDRPVLSADGKSARIAAGGRTLVVLLQDGSLSVAR
ncbi:MAG: hypothetical protein OEO84_10975 [Betaproteobacteria bacterium]|nr:hypothetical protein [Betaproteobacteria bacterium]